MLKLPPGQIILSKGSNKIVCFICSCGRETNRKWSKYASGQAKTCGKCNLLSIEYWTNTKFGNLKMRNPMEIHPKSTNRVEWLCDCGRVAIAMVSNVTNRNKVRCGKCNTLSVDHWKNTKYGRLVMETPKEFTIGSNSKTWWKCNCGQRTFARIVNVTNGNTTSCGKCYNIARTWFQNNKEILSKLKFPIRPKEFPKGLMIPKTKIMSTGIPFQTKCFICDKIYTPRFGDIKLGISLTCGCSTYRVSRGQREVSEFINSLGLVTQLELKVGKYFFDIFIPKLNLLIEYNGSRWHKNKERDLKKYRSICETYEYFIILEHEWDKNREATKNIIMNMVNQVSKSSYEIEPVFTFGSGSGLTPSAPP